MYTIPFINRQKEVDRIVNGDFILLSVCGEGGIGKTRLLHHCMERWKTEKPSPITNVILLNLDKLKEEKDPVTFVLKDIINQAKDLFEGVWSSPEQVAGLIVRHTNMRPNASMLMIFDTVEVLQYNREFWSWLERYLLRPLIQERKVKIVFSGRSPIRWQDFEVRSHAEKPLRLAPLDATLNDGAAAEMITALFKEKNLTFHKEQNHKILMILLGLSCGNPRLIEDLVEYLSESPKIPDDLEFQLGDKVVKTFIETNFFVDFEEHSEWPEFLWWMSVLDQFDTTLLKSYLSEVLPEKVQDKPEYYFLQGIRDLHENSILVWKEGQGEQFQGVMGKIIARCFEVTRRAEYKKANQVAAKVIRELQKDFLEDEEDLKMSYEAQAKLYADRAEKILEVA